MREKIFTLKEANALIPRLELLMEQVQRQAQSVREHVAAAVQASGCAPEALNVAELVRLRPQVQPVLEAMQRVLAEIDACGAQFKGVDLGLVDFPADLDGERVLLCWQYGEKEIAFYHAHDAGFAGRKPLASARRRAIYLQ